MSRRTREDVLNEIQLEAERNLQRKFNQLKVNLTEQLKRDREALEAEFKTRSEEPAK